MRPSIYLSGIMILWGIATVGQGLIHNFEGLVAMRVLIGLFEAGLFPGCVYVSEQQVKAHHSADMCTRSSACTTSAMSSSGV